MLLGCVAYAAAAVAENCKCWCSVRSLATLITVTTIKMPSGCFGRAALPEYCVIYCKLYVGATRVCGLYCSNVLSEYCVIYRNLSVAATGVCVWPVLQQPRIVISYQN
jgi:hypothetical protein